MTGRVHQVTRTTLLLTTLLLVGACNGAARDAAQDRAAIDSLRAEHILAVNSRDADLFLSGMAEGVVCLGPDQAPVLGTSDLGALLRTTYEEVAPDITMTARDVQIQGDLAIEWGCLGGAVHLVAGGDPLPNDGKYLFVYQWLPGTGWKLTHDVYNMGPCDAD
jgi:ketosteroid isomerase-like protein